MYDKLPFPRLNARTPEGQIQELVDYIVQFKEALEFELMEMKEENENLKKAIKNNTHTDE